MRLEERARLENKKETRKEEGELWWQETGQ